MKRNEKESADGSENVRRSVDEIAEEAQRALRERPSVSIRRRLMLGFLLWFVLSALIATYSMWTASRIKQTLRFLEATQNYTFEIQQARRFEKNYFLYGTNLEDATGHVRQARQILEREGADISNVVGTRNYGAMGRDLEAYADLLFSLSELDAEPNRENLGRAAIEAGLREYGAKLVTVAQQLLAEERDRVHAMLDVSQQIPLVFVGLLVLLMIYLTAFIARQMLAPLNRMMAATRRIADGDFTPITPRRRYHDEFSELAMAMNHMMQQLVHRHEQLVQAHKLKAVGTLTAGVAHELNNPLNNLILTSSALMEDYRELDDEEREEMVHDLVTESERAQRIVRNLLDFARESELETEVLEIDKVLDETLQLASNQIKLSKVKVNGDLAGDLPPVYGDRQQICQVFLNIVLNALDAMPGGGNLNISVKNTPDREFISVDFTDTGVGIPEQKLRQIFDPFYTSKRGGKGTGLGLSVSLGMVRNHGGDIRVTSKVGKGTTFSVLLPARKIPAKMPDREDEDAEEMIEGSR